MKGQEGFTLIELLIVMTLFVIVLGITMNTSSLIFKQSSQQAKVAETQMESIVGVEMLRLDLEQAGYGLPWSYPGALSGYSEASASPASNYNDTASAPPRAIAGGSGLGSYVINNSDYLAIKSTIAGMNDASQRWSYIVSGTTPKTWASDNLAVTDRVISIRPQASDTILRQLIVSGVNFSTTYNNVSGFPVQASDLIYGVDSNSNLSMPFNRADYYVRRPSSGIPSLCAQTNNIGILYKATVNQNGGALTELPLLDCVVYMHVVLNLDMNDDGVPDTFSNLDGSTVSPANPNVPSTLASADLLRKRLKEVRVYILAQEGQKDITYTYPIANKILTFGTGTGILTTLNLETTIGADWQNYRWKIITLVVKPKNLY